MKNTDSVDRKGELQYYAIWEKMGEHMPRLITERNNNKD